jgi:tRNA A-37 threonylcarbamoyl transferase component Bud32
MTDAGPILLVVGGDHERLQWLTHHVASHWPNSEVTARPADDPDWLAVFVRERDPDAAILQVNFGNEASASAGMGCLVHMLRANPGLHGIVLAEDGDEMSAVRAMKCGAKDYVPLAGITRNLLIKAVDDAVQKQRAATRAAEAVLASDDAPDIRVPGYAIVKQIATSNFSKVFLARSERLRRHVVLKVMNRGTSAQERADADRFQREYELISSITHRAIAEIYDFGALPDHQYLAMEYIPCGDLRDRLRNPLSADESLYYLRSIAEALRVIHSYGILHRDLKPANIMLREDNSPVLIDFGLARRGGAEDEGNTGAGQVLGSPYYISPEQSQGQRVDLRTDLYSLGVIFYEMLTGERPYVGRTAIAVMAQHAASPVPRLPPVVALQQALIDRLMAKRPEDRYASADELLADLGPLVAEVA